MTTSDEPVPADRIVPSAERALHTFRERGVFSAECSLDLTVFVEVGRR
jgi:hypothetical protein